MNDVPAEAPQSDDPSGGLINRLRKRGEELSHGRRMTLPLPGWEDLGDGRGLWARFRPISRSVQLAWGGTGDSALAEIDFIAPQLASLCEEVLIGTEAERTPLANEPGVRTGGYELIGPLGFGTELGNIVGVGGNDAAAVVKRMLIRSEDDIAFYAVWSELLAWSGAVGMKGVETAAGE